MQMQGEYFKLLILLCDLVQQKKDKQACLHHLPLIMLVRPDYFSIFTCIFLRSYYGCGVSFKGESCSQCILDAPKLPL